VINDFGGYIFLEVDTFIWILALALHGAKGSLVRKIGTVSLCKSWGLFKVFGVGDAVSNSRSLVTPETRP